MPDTRCPQTVSFEVQFFWEWTPYIVEVIPIDTFEEIGPLIYTERHRRAKKDRPLCVRWRNILTDHGREFYRKQYGSLNDLSPKLGITLDDWQAW